MFVRDNGTSTKGEICWSLRELITSSWMTDYECNDNRVVRGKLGFPGISGGHISYLKYEERPDHYFENNSAALLHACHMMV